jgi:hypothetical protein
MTPWRLKRPQLLPLDPILNRCRIDTADLADFKRRKKRVSCHNDALYPKNLEL